LYTKKTDYRPYDLEIRVVSKSASNQFLKSQL